MQRPITEAELPYLADFGQQLATLRRNAGLSQRALADRAQLSVKQIKRLEHGQRRTRASTLQRIAEALTKDPQAVHADLVSVLGPALAPESQYAERISRRRDRRHPARVR